MANTVYDNKVIESVAKDLLTTSLNTRSLMTIDNELAESAGMLKTVNTYTYKGEAEELANGVGNTASKRGSISYTGKDYRVKLCQQAYDYTDEEAMKDPFIVDGMMRGAVQVMTNKMTADFISAVKSTDVTLGVTFAKGGALNYDTIVDAISTLNLEDESQLFILIPNTWKASLRKDEDYKSAMMGQVIYNGQVGTICGIPVIATKALTDSAFVMTKEAVKDVWDKLSVVLGEIIKVVGVVISTVLGVLVGGVEMIASIIGGIADVLTGIIDFLTGVFTGDWEKAWTGIKEIVLGILDAISGVFEGFIDGLIEGITNLGNAINDLFGKDKKKKNTYTLNTNSKINLKNQAKNINIPQMRAFANGGVLSSPTVGLMGEYTGASNNPEIVTPQSLMRETMEDANASLINAIFAIGNQISKSVDDKNMDVYMDTAKVTRRITKEQTAQKKQMGTSLVMV